jgi:hypothetical protein
MFKDLAKTDVVCATVVDIKDEQFFKAMYYVLRVIFPAIRALHFCDKGEPCLDKIYYLSKHATVAFDRSKGLLNDTGLFNFEIDKFLEEYAANVYGVRVKERTMKKRKCELCIACTHWKRSSHITHSCFCRDDGNKDAIMAEPVTLRIVKTKKMVRRWHHQWPW